MTNRLAILAAVLAAPLVLAGCNSEPQGQGTDNTTTGTTQPETTNPEAPAAAPETPVVE